MKTRPIYWTEERAMELIQDVTNELMADSEIIYIGQLFEYRKQNVDILAKFKKKFKDNRKILLAIKNIYSVLESRAVHGALTGKLNSTMSIFHLKNNYGWKDTLGYDANVQLPTININILNNKQDNGQLSGSSPEQAEILHEESSEGSEGDKSLPQAGGSTTL